MGEGERKKSEFEKYPAILYTLPSTSTLYFRPYALRSMPFLFATRSSQPKPPRAIGCFVNIQRFNLYRPELFCKLFDCPRCLNRCRANYTILFVKKSRAKPPARKGCSAYASSATSTIRQSSFVIPCSFTARCGVRFQPRPLSPARIMQSGKDHTPRAHGNREGCRS